jgi:hypothetical protein
MTGPTGGRLAIAGEAGVTICAPRLGWGRMRRGAGAAGCAGAAATGALACIAGRGGAAAGRTAEGAAADGAELDAGGCTATAGGRGGMLRASDSACLRARIAFSASPGLEMCERSKAGFGSLRGRDGLPPVRWPLK